MSSMTNPRYASSEIKRAGGALDLVSGRDSASGFGTERTVCMGSVLMNDRALDSTLRCWRVNWKMVLCQWRYLGLVVIFPSVNIPATGLPGTAVQLSQICGRQERRA
jgi:hypothetical protein